MKTRGLIDLYLPKNIAYHLKLLLASLFITFLFVFIRDGRLWAEGSIHLLILLLIQFEFFIWLGGKFFSNGKQLSPNKLVRWAVKRLILFFMLAFILSSIIYLAYMFIIYLVYDYPLSDLLPNILSTEIQGFVIGASSGYVIGSVIFFYLQWVDALKREQALREEKLVFQYETLKSQVNPHFLFNSLNTLSSLVYKDPELSDEFIRRLSTIYRYILENMDNEWIDLERELHFVNNYFYLQQVRDNGKIDMAVNIKNPEKYKILPISLQMLVENALKHNIATRDLPLKILIGIDESRNRIIIRNNLNVKQQIERSSKIGLKNLNERLKLILQEEISIQETDHEFIVELPLKPVSDASADH